MERRPRRRRTARACIDTGRDNEARKASGAQRAIIQSWAGGGGGCERAAGAAHIVRGDCCCALTCCRRAQRRGARPVRAAGRPTAVRRVLRNSRIPTRLRSNRYHLHAPAARCNALLDCATERNKATETRRANDERRASTVEKRIVFNWLSSSFWSSRLSAAAPIEWVPLFARRRLECVRSVALQNVCVAARSASAPISSPAPAQKWRWANKGALSGLRKRRTLTNDAVA